MQNLITRKQTRLKDYNYALNGWYFITICSKNRENIFGEISALFSAPRIATVTTSKPSLILEMDKNDFIKLLEQAPNLKQVVHKQFGKRKLQTTIQTQQATNR